ncbi:MAG TPA: hypothetical protein DDY98_06090 [Ruminococcaceae bacterium]|nr:hypothetical protein [Oscillospiraceae bacterium]
MAKKNYNYGKIEDGKLVYAPNKLKGMIEDEDGNEIAVQIINGTAAQYAMSGWLPILRAKQPEPTEDGYYRVTYDVVDGMITERYVFEEDEE